MKFPLKNSWGSEVMAISSNMRACCPPPPRRRRVKVSFSQKDMTNSFVFHIFVAFQKNSVYSLV